MLRTKEVLMDAQRRVEDVDCLRMQATFIAIVVHKAMEDFRVKHLSDEQMKELNPIIKNAIFTALYAEETLCQSERSKEFLKYHWELIPPSWQEPELLNGFEEP
jgi:hypothetical protein